MSLLGKARRCLINYQRKDIKENSLLGRCDYTFQQHYFCACPHLTILIRISSNLGIMITPLILTIHLATFRAWTLFYGNYIGVATRGSRM